MSEIILFRYHKSYDVCVQALRQLRRLNPQIPIHGLYGGNDSLDDLPHELTSYFASNWVMPLDDPYYKWKNGDLCARWWFRDHGQNIAFDHAYFLEWDMLFFKPLIEIYGPLEQDANYGTIFGDFNHIAETKWYWMTGQFGVETDQLMEHLKTNGLPVAMEKLSFSIMGGTAFCRRFLELYIAAPVPSYTNDEVRLSYYSYAYGIPFKNNSIKDKARDGRNIYVADNEVLSEADVDGVIARDGDVIHPLRIMLPELDQKLGF